MKKFLSIIAFAVMAALVLPVFLTSCGDEETIVNNIDTLIGDTNIVRVTANITEDATWKSGKTYILTTRIAVISGVTLTIEPGVLVKGEAGTGVNASALIIARGAKLMAEGTASQPIIFTTVADEIVPGQIASPNLDPDANGFWGGLIVLGKAPISGDAAELQIEGIPASDVNGLYGGTDAADNSGVIKYVSIRHGGTNIGEGNEINGLTLGGVGSGTVIDYVEVIGNQDDGIEWFGGTVNVSNAIVWNAGDDAIDTDQSWGGTLDNFVVITPGDECFELDGPEGTMVAKHTITNGSVNVGHADGLVDLDDNSNVDMSNVLFYNIEITEAEATAEAGVVCPDFDQLPVDYICTFSGFEIIIPTTYENEDEEIITIDPALTLTKFFKKGSDAFATVVTNGSVGADLTKFASWSWASVADAIE